MTVLEFVVMDYIPVSVNRDQPEKVLCARLAEGEIAAVGEAYDRYHEAVRAFARRLVGANDTAEDLVQEVFVTLPNAIRRFRGDATLKTFLLSIAVNHSRHHVRGAMRRRRALERLTVVRDHDGQNQTSEDPEQLVRRKQIAQLLQRGLDRLPLDQRVAFVLCEVEERSSVEVAQIVNAPEATVRTRVFHAKKKLRSFLEQEGGLS